MELNYQTIFYRPAVRKHLSILFIGFLLGILLYSFIKFNDSQSYLEYYLSGFLGVLVSYGVYYSNSKLNQILPFKKLPGTRILAGIIWGLILSYSIVILGFWSYSVVMDYQFSFENESSLFIKIGILLFCVAIIYNVIYFALYSYNYFAKVQVKELAIQRKQAELQLNVLKSQLRPHFLFNSINVLTSLFHKDLALAELFIRALAKSYDYTLTTYNSTLVTVKEELAFVNAYLLLIQTRFGNGFDLMVELDDSTQETNIPPLTLQLLIENASKHNFFDNENPLKVKLYRERNELIITNLKSDKTNKKNVSTKLGLKNISSRYAILTGKKITILDNESFTVKLPVIV
ncbi:sensor histidine kinase [Croceitalea marina]|uniref:Sensor histidine kinase n=1 Tax=Croceitalea marina TaxID=1775166 RepID=A0ABW5MQD5_9FLAO